jgi:para-nitrobenzyl esterase
MLFIHGGNFQVFGGNSPLFNSTFFAAYGDVVIVTINYRLGINYCNNKLNNILLLDQIFIIGALGFLVTGLEDGQAHGNYGILDQKQAIKWTYDNIGLFGGDTERVSI